MEENTNVDSVFVNFQKDRKDRGELRLLGLWISPSSLAFQQPLSPLLLQRKLRHTAFCLVHDNWTNKEPLQAVSGTRLGAHGIHLRKAVD